MLYGHTDFATHNRRAWPRLSIWVVSSNLAAWYLRHRRKQDQTTPECEKLEKKTGGWSDLRRYLSTEAMGSSQTISSRIESTKGEWRKRSDNFQRQSCRKKKTTVHQCKLNCFYNSGSPYLAKIKVGQQHIMVSSVFISMHRVYAIKMPQLLALAEVMNPKWSVIDLLE